MPLNSRAVATHLRAFTRTITPGAPGRTTEPARASLLDGLRTSTDQDEFFLVGLYDLVLGREPDRDGMAAHLGALRAGASRADVIAGVAASGEAQQALDDGTRDADLPAPDAFVAHGVAVVAGVLATEDELDRTLARLRSGVPLPVLVRELNPAAVLEPWQSVLARRLLDGLPHAADAGVVDRVLAKIDAFEEPEAVLALVLPGRSPLTRLRRARRATRAVQYATLELAAAARGGSDVVTVPAAAAARTPRVDLEPVVRRLTALEKAAAAVADRAADVRVVEVDGMLLGVPSQEWRLAAYLERRGHPEPGLAEQMLPLLTEGATFVDVGANVGLYTVAAARAVGPTGHVVALEPTPGVAEVLRQNVQLNGLLEAGTVDVHELAVGAAPGAANLAVHSSDSGHNTLFTDGRATGEVPVDVLPLDALVPVGTRVDVVKVDVEGAELAVLEGMRRIAEENPAIVVFAELADEHLRRAGSSAAGLLDAAERLGWRAEVFHTVSGERVPASTTGAPLTACLVRAQQVAS